MLEHSPTQASAAAAPNAVEISGLAKTYPAGREAAEKRALKGVDLQVPQGAILGLLGPNGAGKSTLINILAGMTVKSAGAVRIWGFDQDANPRMSRASIGVVPQELYVDPFLTPRQALETQAGLYGLRPHERRTDALLAAMALSDKADAYARTLSGGMRRRLLVAKAMAHDPPVLVLDEPTAGVDVALRRQLWDYVRALNADGVTVILTTHYLEEAEALCDRIAILHQGRLRAVAPTAEMVASIERKTLRLTLETAPDAAALARLRAALPAAATLERAEGRELAIAWRPRAAPAAALLEAAGRAGGAVVDLAVDAPTLEDVFLELTREDGGGAEPAPEGGA